jgi:hypothetical protein
MTVLVLIGLGQATAPVASADGWTGVVAGGGGFNFVPQLTGHGWVMFDAVGKGVVGTGDLHAFYNTTKLHIAVERVSFAKGKLAFFAFAEGEALLSQLLRDYFKRGERIREFGFNASYALIDTKLQWYPGKYQTIELVLAARHWWFDATSRTSSSFELPPNTWTFEPRLGYVFWKIDAADREWEAHRFYPRVKGVALGIRGGIDIRSNREVWGIVEGRNDPGQPIYTLRQWLRAGWQFVPLARLQVEQRGSYGWHEDDITRNRIGGVNPYVVPVPGLPWTGLISERLFSALLGFHIKAKESSPHEFGVLVGGGAFNDVTREGALKTYGGAGGVAVFGDLRFGERDRYQLHARFSYGFPVVWLLDGPYVGGLVTFGARVF